MSNDRQIECLGKNSRGQQIAWVTSDLLSFADSSQLAELASRVSRFQMIAEAEG